jgi:hypothetical protein
MRTHWGFCLHFLLLVYSWFGVALTLGFLRAEQSDDSASKAEYRPKKTHSVTTGLDPVVHGDARRTRQHGEAERAGSLHGLPDQVRQ